MNTQYLRHGGNVTSLPALARGLPTTVRLALTSRRGWLLMASCILILGGALRVAAYVGDRSLFVDEAALAHNILTRSFSGLVGPLDGSQGAPLGYLFLVKAIVLAAGKSEYALRAWSLVAALGSLLAFGAVAGRWLTAIESLLACALFAFCPTLVFFASEGKQYSSDVFVTTLLLYTSARTLETPSSNCLIALGLVGLIATWLSHPAAFLLAAIGILLLVKALRTGRVGAVMAIAAVGLTWLTSLGFLYVMSLRSLESNQDLLTYWQGSFVPLSVAPAANWVWYAYWRMAQDHFGLYGEASGYLVGWLFAVGVIGLWIAKDRRGVGWLISGPLVFTVLASAAHLYPFGGYGGRLLLFAVPLIILGAVTGWSIVCSRGGWVLPVTLAVAIFVPTTRLSLKQARNDIASHRAPEELRPLMDRLQQEVRPGDHLYVVESALPTYSIYADGFSFLSGRELQVHRGQVSLSRDNVDPAEYENDLQPLRGSGRVWLVVAHASSRTITDEDAVLLAARKYGSELANYREKGAGLYLFDFGPHGRSPSDGFPQSAVPTR